MAILSKAIYMFNAIPIRIPMTFITEIKKIYLKVHLETQKNANSQGNTEQKGNAGGYHNTRLQTICTSFENCLFNSFTN
jgi:hypothetical protein